MSNKNYDLTPSFFKTQEMFEKYLGQTSYYNVLQNDILKLCSFINPKIILELGSATGNTSMLLAKNNPQSKIIGIDMRQDVVDVANKLSRESNIQNVSFEKSDFLEYPGYSEANFIVMLYSFHHIPDPIEEKEKFLHKLKNETERGTYLCIGETFLPKRYSDMNKEEILEFWNLRAEEGRAATFWSSLSGIEKENILKSTDIADFCARHESIAGDEVAKRETEFLVTGEELIEMSKRIGWEIILSFPCNTIGEEVVLLKNC